jgi:6-phosphogluconate dehydrogenase
MAQNTYDFGMVGLGTMGRSLLLNMADHGASVVGLDTDAAKAAALTAEGERGGINSAVPEGEEAGMNSAVPREAVISSSVPEGEEAGINSAVPVGEKAGINSAVPVGTTDPKAFVAMLRQPRAIMMLVPAGAAVDSVIAELSPLLEKGDILIDGGNSFFEDTDRRGKELAAKGLEFLGLGVSGGESGARHGPSMMAGGTAEAYEHVRGVLESVAAKFGNEPCVALMGPGSAGHYVKMVHNGIEYGLMQLIAETYDTMRRGLGMSNDFCRSTFEKWNSGILQGFLIEITGTVLRKKEDGRDLVDLISDKAKQKGTGKWASQDAMDLGVPIPTIDAAVTARVLSSLKDERVEAYRRFPPKAKDSSSELQSGSIENLEKALMSAMLLTYAQGFAQLRAASDEYGYGLNLETVA